MTAEILIMNKLGVALAADSAVTVSQGNDTKKVFDTACKLFTLSKFEPVGIMFYGEANLGGLPWESVIKAYREYLGRASFGHLELYAQDMIAFIEQQMIPESCQIKWFREHVLGYFMLMKDEIDQGVKAIIDSKGEIVQSEIATVAEVVIDNHLHKWNEYATLSIMEDDDYTERLKIAYAGTVHELRIACFENLPLAADLIESLLELSISIVRKDFFSSYSGFVISGFGKKDIFPSYIEYQVDGVVCGRLRRKELDKQSIDDDIEAAIKPLAQQEMVHGFLRGIEPELYGLYRASLKTLLEDKYPETILANLDLTVEQRADLGPRLVAFGKSAFEGIQNSLDQVIRERHVTPVVDAVQFLQKDELAEMAESFVYLTSLKRRISLEPETVGGPIDVAVISKGDGFIWIKRKHYFRADLNHHFFQNYFRSASSED